MSTIKLRPTFSISTQLSELEAVARIEQVIEQESGRISGQFRAGHGMISILESKRQFWSPWLHVDIRETEFDRQVVGRFSPHPSVWTAFMFTYLSLSVLSFFSIIIGWSQQLAGIYAWGYFILPICAVIAVVLWLISQTGQRLAHDEMLFLKTLIESSIEKPNTTK